MFTDFLNHVCDIYHVIDSETNPGYGITAAEPTKTYPEEADVSGVRCHFNLNSSVSIIQHEPYSSVEGEDKLTLPYGVDIRENDYVVDVTDGGMGYGFIAGVPRTVHGNHHIVVTIKRQEGVKGAI